MTAQDYSWISCITDGKTRRASHVLFPSEQNMKHWSISHHIYREECNICFSFVFTRHKNSLFVYFFTAIFQAEYNCFFFVFFLMRRVPWHTTAIKLSVKARWLVANLGKPPGSRRILLVTLLVDLQKDERRGYSLWITTSIHTTTYFIILCDILSVIVLEILFPFPVELKVCLLHVDGCVFHSLGCGALA